MRILLGLLAFLALALPAHAQSFTPAARQVIAAARAASGGAAWNELRGLHETGRLDGARYQSWHDPVRYGARLEIEEATGRRVQGFSGMAAWQILPDGRILGGNDRTAVAQARTAAYLAVHGWFFPSRFGADAAHVGVRNHKGRAYDVLTVTPLGGEPRELWFDRRTRLLSRIVDRTGAAPVTTELSDHRRVGGLLLPFRAVTDRGGGEQVRQVEAIELSPADRSRFSWSPDEGRWAGA